MLETLRKHTKSWFVKILFALIIVSFAFWGVGDVVRNISIGGATIAVGDTEVSQQELANAFRNDLRQIQQSMGGLTPEEARDMGLLQMTVDRLVTQALLDEETRVLDLAVTDDNLRRHIQAMEVFRNQLGRFDRQRFQQVLYSAGMSEQQFIAAERANIMRRRLVDAVAGSPPAPETMAEAMYRFRQEQRVVEAILLSAEDMPPPEAPAESVLRAYHQENEAAFTAPEYREIAVLLVGPDDVAGDIEVTEDDLREAYEVRLDQFGKPERRQVRQVLFQDGAQAEEARAVLNRGGDLQDVAEALDSSVIDLGWVERGTLPPEIEDPVFALGEGEIGEPVQSGLGWHVFAVDGVEEGEARDFEEVRDELRQAVIEDRALDHVYELVNQVEDALAGGATLEEAAQQYGLELKTLKIDAQGRTPEGEPPADFALTDAVVAAAFETEIGMDSGMREIGGNSFFVVRVDEVTPPTLRPFETVRDEVLAAWSAEQRLRKAREAAEAALERVRAGADLQAVAAELGAEVEVSDPFTRRGAADLPQPLVQRAFALDAGQAAVVELPQGAVLARLREVIPAEPRQGAPVLAQIEAQIAQGMANDLVAQYLGALQETYSIEVNRAKVEEIVQ